jgi:hypothetical protein
VLPGLVLGFEDLNPQIPLNDIAAIIISHDYSVPTEYKLYVEICSSAEHVEGHCRQDEIAMKEKSASPVKMKRQSVVVDALKSVGRAVKSAAKDTASGVVDGVMLVAGGVASALTGNANVSSCHVVAKVAFQSGLETNKMQDQVYNFSDSDVLQSWKETFSTYLSEDDIRMKSRSTDRRPNRGLGLFLWETKPGYENIIGEYMLPFHELLNSKNREQKISKTFHMDTRTGVRVTLMRAHNLSSPSAVGVTSTVTRVVDSVTTVVQLGNKGLFIPVTTNDVRDCYVKFTLAKWNGERTHSKNNKVYKSAVVKGSLNPEWNPKANESDPNWYSKHPLKEEYRFVAEDGLDWAEYVRLEVWDARNAANATLEERIGAIFIPIVDFPLHEEERTYRITSSKPLASYLRNVSLGEITVRIQRIQEIDDSFNRNLTINSWLLRSTIYNTYWFTRCIPAGDVDKSGAELSEETFVLAPLYSGLVMKDLDHIEKHSVGTSMLYSTTVI